MDGETDGVSSLVQKLLFVTFLKIYLINKFFQ